MDYDRIILEMLDRIKHLEDEVSLLKGNNSTAPLKNDESIKASKKYRRLTDVLDQASGAPVKLSFSDIESIIGFKLPASAREHRAFWANTTTHSIALSWLSVDYKTVEVNLDDEFIVFER